MNITTSLDNLKTLLEKINVEIVTIKGFEDDVDKKMKEYEGALADFTKFETIYKDHKAQVDEITKEKSSLEEIKKSIEGERGVIEVEKGLLRDKQKVLEEKEKELTEKARRIQELLA